MAKILRRVQEKSLMLQIKKKLNVPWKICRDPLGLGKMGASVPVDIRHHHVNIVCVVMLIARRGRQMLCTAGLRVT